MTHNTTPVVGDVWEHNESGLKLTVMSDRVIVVVLRHDTGSRELMWADKWHAWAANARRVG